MVLPHDSRRETAIGKGIGVITAQHIAAPGIVTMADAQLTEQCGSQVTLVHQHLHATRLTYGTSQPEHGGMEELRILVTLLVEISMVGDHDDQQIVPLGKSLEAINKQAHRIIGISKGIELLVLQPVVGHHPRFMT